MTLLEFGYIGLTLLMTVILLLGYRSALKKIGAATDLINRRSTLVALSIVGWWCYVYVLSVSGILKVLSFPPRFPLFLIIPLFIFTGVFLYKKKKVQFFKPSRVHGQSTFNHSEYSWNRYS